MPTPRISGSIGRQAGRSRVQAQPSRAAGTWHKAVVTGVFGDLSNRAYCDVDGLTVQAVVVIDAPIKVGDVVWVVPDGAGGWNLAGTA